MLIRVGRASDASRIDNHATVGKLDDTWDMVMGTEDERSVDAAEVGLDLLRRPRAHRTVLPYLV